MKNFTYKTIFILTLLICFAAASSAQSVRVKDISSIGGVRDNQLVGMGLVVGLDGTGDTQQTKFTTQAMANMINEYGITLPASSIKIKNAAVVMVTAQLPAFARKGSTIDVVVSSIGDAKSLQGGTLMQTPLKAANGEVYAVAQGPVSLGGYTAGGGGSSATKNHPTVGRIPNGALIEKETNTTIAPGERLSINLHTNDFTTAQRVAQGINDILSGGYATAVDGNSISVSIPSGYQDNLVSLISQIEKVEVTTDTVAKVIVNERTGTVVIGGAARITPVAVAHGNLTVEITTDFDVSQPEPISTGQTVVTPRSDVKITEKNGSLMKVGGNPTIDDLVRALNALQVTPRDLIAILQAIKQAGALQAQLEVI